MKVRVKTWEEMLENDKVEEDSGDLIYGDYSIGTVFVSEMKHLCGKVIELNDAVYDDPKRKIGWVFEHWMYDEIEPEVCCSGDNIWICHICENTYDNSVEECPNVRCDRITRKGEILDIINDYIGDNSTWILSEQGNILTLDIKRK